MLLPRKHGQQKHRYFTSALERIQGGKKFSQLCEDQEHLQVRRGDPTASGQTWMIIALKVRGSLRRVTFDGGWLW